MIGLNKLISSVFQNTSYTVLRLDIVLVSCAATPKSPAEIYIQTSSLDTGHYHQHKNTNNIKI